MVLKIDMDKHKILKDIKVNNELISIYRSDKKDDAGFYRYIFDIKNSEKLLTIDANTKHGAVSILKEWLDSEGVKKPSNLF